MSAMSKFIGVDCAPCRRAGHKCQAQMMTDAGPSCLRCANGDACFAVTAAQNFETPKRMLNDGYDQVVMRSKNANQGERYGILAATA